VSEGRSAAKTRTPLKMVKQATKRRRSRPARRSGTCRKWTARLTGTGQVPWPSTFAQDYDRTGGSYGRYAGRGAELKFFDTSLSFLFDTTGEVPATGQLVLIPQGVTESTRVGRKCVIKSVHLKGITQGVLVLLPTFATTAYLYLVLDKQANGAAAAFTDVMSTTLLATSFHNLANSQRFVY